MFKFSLITLNLLILSQSFTIYFPLLPAVPPGLVQFYQFRPNFEPLWELDENQEKDFTCPGDGLFPDPSSGCSSFYRCEKDQVQDFNIQTDSLAVLQSWRFSCLSGLKFDATEGVCRWGADVSDSCIFNS